MRPIRVLKSGAARSSASADGSSLGRDPGPKGLTWKGTFLRTLVAIALAVMLFPVTSGKAGPAPNLLDDNRGNGTLATAYSAAYTVASSTVLLPNPLTFVYEPVSFSGRVLGHPAIHNLYFDDNWDANNPGAPTTEQLDAFTQDLVNSHYFDSAAQYGVGSATFTGSNQRSTLCDPLRNTVLSLGDPVSLQAWIVCEASFNPFADAAGIPPGTLPAATGVPQANDNTVYVVYLPPQVTLLGNENCASGNGYGGYHFFSIVPAIHVAIPPTYSQTFAYVIIPTGCNGATPQPSQSFLDGVTQAASHEIIEASVDPLLALGWINNSPVFSVTGPIEGPLDLFTQFLTNIGVDFSDGEAADICEVSVGTQNHVPTGQVGPPPKSLHPTSPFYLAVNDSSLNNMISVEPYWSNSDNACVPGGPVTAASLSPAANSAGWNSTSVDVSLTSTEPGGTIAQIQYTLSGAQVGGNTVSAAMTSFTISNQGVTTVTFFSTDNAGNVEAPKTVTVMIDETPPTVSAPPNVTVGTGPGATVCGAVVPTATLGTATATDLSGIISTPVATGVPPGNLFPVGTTSVVYTATNVVNLTGSATQLVTVNDTTPPILATPANITVNATSPAGAVVNFALPVATDNCPGVTLAASPVSGSTFAIGTTTVTVTATDAAANATTKTFMVTVVGAAGQTGSLGSLVTAFGLPNGTTTSLLAKLNATLAAINLGETGLACGDLTAFINEVSAQSGKKIPAAEAAQLISAAMQIRAVLGCG